MRPVCVSRSRILLAKRRAKASYAFYDLLTFGFSVYGKTQTSEIQTKFQEAPIKRPEKSLTTSPDLFAMEKRRIAY